MPSPTFLADLCQLNVSDIDWDWALCHMDADCDASTERSSCRGVVHPITHTLDLALGCLAQPSWLAGWATVSWPLSLTVWLTSGGRPSTVRLGLLVDSAYYEGGKWNYSFRLLPDMDSRIQLAGGDDRFLDKLDARSSGTVRSRSSRWASDPALRN